MLQTAFDLLHLGFPMLHHILHIASLSSLTDIGLYIPNDMKTSSTIGSINTIEISLAINYSCTPQAISTQ